MLLAMTGGREEMGWLKESPLNVIASGAKQSRVPMFAIFNREVHEENEENAKFFIYFLCKQSSRLFFLASCTSRLDLENCNHSGLPRRFAPRNDGGGGKRWGGKSFNRHCERSEAIQSAYVCCI